LRAQFGSVMDKKKLEAFRKKLEARQQDLRRMVTRTQQDECISCGKEINPKRLEAVPWTRHCIECQEKLEQGILEEASR
jgi:RNA polymerase-binding transcription factor DksA